MSSREGRPSRNINHAVNATDSEAQCSNCGTIHKAKFCPECGQKAAVPLPENAILENLKGTATAITSKAQCILGHDWDGCKCKRCGKIRDEQHRFEQVDDRCEQKCAICGKTEPLKHQWEGSVWDGKKCTVCGLSKKPVSKRVVILSIVGGIILLLAIIFGSVSSIEKNKAFHIELGEVKLPYASDLVGKNYKQVVKIFSDRGFTNIETRPMNDLNDEFLDENGQVHKVSVNGETNFSPGGKEGWVAKNSDVVVVYHSFAETPEITTQKSTTAKTTTAKTTQRIENTESTSETSYQLPIYTTSASLDAAAAWIFADQYGKKEYPYGFKLHWMTGKLAERAEDDNTWFLKATCDVKNAYGTWAKGLNCEARVTGTNDLAMVIYFVVY